MRNRSLKLQRAMRVYRSMVKDFLDENPHCQFPLGCDQPATDVHHRRGRFGKRLIDKRYWSAACHTHNDFAESNTGAALDCGWLVRIEGADT